MIERAPRNYPFVMVPNDTVRDRRLSFRARGILAYILSMPDGWQTTSERIAEAGIEGREAVRTCMKEMEKAGYLRRIKTQGTDGRWSTKTVAYDHPAPNEPTTENPSSVPPAETRESPGRTEDRKSVRRFPGRLKEEDLSKKTSNEDIPLPPTPTETVPVTDILGTPSPPPAGKNATRTTTPRRSSPSRPSSRSRARAKFDDNLEQGNAHDPCSEPSADSARAPQASNVAAACPTRDEQRAVAREIADYVMANRHPAPMANVRDQMAVYVTALQRGWKREQVQAAAMTVSRIHETWMETELNKRWPPRVQAAESTRPLYTGPATSEPSIEERQEVAAQMRAWREAGRPTPVTNQEVAS